jgi:hypothetical protein
MKQTPTKPKYEEWELRQYGPILARAVAFPGQMFDIMAANKGMTPGAVRRGVRA